MNVWGDDKQTFRFVPLWDEDQHAEETRRLKGEKIVFIHTLIVSTCRLTMSFNTGKSSRRNVVTSPSGKALANLEHEDIISVFLILYYLPARPAICNA